MQRGTFGIQILICNYGNIGRHMANVQKLIPSRTNPIYKRFVPKKKIALQGIDTPSKVQSSLALAVVQAIALATYIYTCQLRTVLALSASLSAIYSSILCWPSYGALQVSVSSLQHGKSYRRVGSSPLKTREAVTGRPLDPDLRKRGRKQQNTLMCTHGSTVQRPACRCLYIR